MTNGLSALEEFDAQRRIQFPYLLHAATDLSTKKSIARIVLATTEKSVLLISPSGFGESSVIAGLTQKNIEHFLKFAPKDYKESLYSAITNSLVVRDAWDIAKAIDEDSSERSTINQDRFKKVIQYMQDNRTVFQF